MGSPYEILLLVGLGFLVFLAGAGIAACTCVGAVALRVLVTGRLYLPAPRKTPPTDRKG